VDIIINAIQDKVTKDKVNPFTILPNSKPGFNSPLTFLLSPFILWKVGGFKIQRHMLSLPKAEN
jgi:hypothetical protein